MLLLFNILNMVDQNDGEKKIKLNLGAKEFKPTFKVPVTQPQNTQGYNPMMQGMQGNYYMNNLPQQGQGMYQQPYPINNMYNPNSNITNQTVPQTKQQEKPQQKKNDEKIKEKPKEVKKDDKKQPQKSTNQATQKTVDKPKETKVESKTEVPAMDNLNLMDQEELDNIVSKEGKMVEVDESRDQASIVFIGHVDHGKSTVCGNILLLTGQVDQRTIEKYKCEAIKNKRESWYLAYLMDQNDEEKEKGKTVEIGKANFSLEKKRYTILDGPGHVGFLPNLLLGACQADFACLVISAKEGEFEAGFEKSGSTREHALLAKSLGVSKVVILVNKMDEESVNWSEKRFNTIRNNLFDYLKKIGYKEDDVYWVPISGLHGDNIKVALDKTKAPWYNGPTFFEVLDNLPVLNRDNNGPLRFSILDRYKDGGMHVMGKVESGVLKYGASYTMMPTKMPIEIQWIFNHEDNGLPYAKTGEAVRVS